MKKNSKHKQVLEEVAYLKLRMFEVQQGDQYTPNDSEGITLEL